MTNRKKISRRQFIVLSGIVTLAFLIYPLQNILSKIFSRFVPPVADPVRTPTPTETPASTPTQVSTQIPTSTNIAVATSPNPGLLTSEKMAFLVNHPINHGRTEDKIAIMTYDEGIVATNVAHLLTVYKAIEGKCTFFMTGAGLTQSVDLLPRIVDEGHVIGCHGFDHVNLAELKDEEIAAQFTLWFKKIRSILPDYQVNYFRAPFGSYDARVLEIAASFGLQHVFWNVESGGLVPGTLDNIFNGFHLYQNFYKAVGGAIVLSHTMRDFDISQAMNIVNKWSEMGYQLVTIDQGKKAEDTWKG
jgi:peptidoglycan-N-acetylmuramic acid deacetylase